MFNICVQVFKKDYNIIYISSGEASVCFKDVINLSLIINK